MTETAPHRPGRPAQVVAAGACALALLLAGTVETARAETFADLSYDLGSPPPVAAHNRLDVYTPTGARPGDSLPVVAYVHGGGWRRGDKSNRIADKVALFTGAGYVFVSVNYRLSPEALSATPDPARIRFPDHPHDVGEALGWLDRNLAAYGGDPGRIALIGHSAGAHLVSLLATDPSYLVAYGVEPWQVVGAIPLDTGAFDVEARIGEVTAAGRLLYHNAFGTPAEDAADGSWTAASPITWADAGDAEQLLVTQAASPARVAENTRMASALGQDPDQVVLVPYDHGEINAAVGAADDPAGETEAIMGFLARTIAAAEPPIATIGRHPPKRVRSDRRRVGVRFRFRSADSAASFECRLDGKRFRACESPRRLRVGRGGHRFRVRAIAASGRPGPAASHRFRVIRRR